jgi:hypothetical protein
MTERGGTTTQSGILYQNSVTALRMGRMLDPTARPGFEVIVLIRAEAWEHVDDTVVTFRDGHREFIQAKEALADVAWGKLWSDVAAQFRDATFDRTRDRVLLVFGEVHHRIDDLRGSADRAHGALNVAEWFERMAIRQRDLVRDITGLTGFADGSDELLSLFHQIDVETITLRDIERDLVPRWMPASTETSSNLFGLLRDRVGGNARQRITFDRETLLASLVDKDPSFRLTVVSDDDVARSANATTATLLSHRATFGNTRVHVQRPVVQELRAWLRTPESDGAVALLLDEAGAGKSVVMRDLVEQLADDGFDVLAMKADLQLTGATSADEIQKRLKLPEPVERVVERLARSKPVVVMIDQIDALSLTLAHDATTLLEVLDLVARLIRIRGARLLISCRAFDRSNDIRLRRLDVKKEMRSAELTDDELRDVLAAASIDLAKLTPNTKKLLRLPLHLDLFLLAATQDSQPVTLQDLYAALLRAVAFREGEAVPSLSNRIRALKDLTATMYQRQRTSMPVTFFAELGGDSLHSAAVWLASEGILLQTDTGWAFRHQTLFDYLFARDFVEAGNSLVAHLRASPQGLSSRSALIQVLAYQRSTDPDRYLAELSAIWRGTDIRFHLRHLLLRWFGSLPNPTSAETQWARRLLLDANSRKRFLSAARENAAWFHVLRSDLESLIHSDELAIDDVLWFFQSVMPACQREIVEIIRPYLRCGEAWVNRCRWLVSFMREWTAPEAIDFFDEVMQTGCPLPEHFMEFKDMARLDPEKTAVAVLHLLDAQLSKLSGEASPSDVIDTLRVFSGGDLDDALEIVAERVPVTWLTGVITWMERAFAFTDLNGTGGRLFRYDAIALWSHNLPDAFERHLLRSGLRALLVLAEADQQRFLAFVTQLQAIPYISAQILIAQALTHSADKYATEACLWLLADPRRLWLGSGEAIHTRRLIAAVAPYLPAESHRAIEAAILAHKEWRSDDLQRALQWSGVEHLYLLSAIPRECMSDDARRRFDELRRKFPKVDLSLDHTNSGVRMVWGHSPIDAPAAAKMRDDDWLRAMAKYSGGSQPIDWSFRTARALAGNLKEEAKKDPQRFAALATRLPDDVADEYVADLLAGLVQSSGATPAVISLARRFAPSADRDLRRAISWTLGKLPRDIPPDLLDQLESWVRDPSLDDEHAVTTLDYLNTDRGSALLTLGYALRVQDFDKNMARRWKLYDYVGQHGSASLRAAAIEELRYEIYDRRDEVLDLFERLLKTDETQLLDAPHLTDLVHAALWKTFGRVQPLIFDLVASQKEKHQQSGARLLAIAAVSPRALTPEELDLARKAVDLLLERGSTSHKTAIAYILSWNIDDSERAFCFTQLAKLFDDPDEKARSSVAQAFHQMTGADLIERGEWLSDYAKSPALPHGLHAFSEYLLEHGSADVTRTLNMINVALDNQHGGDEKRWFDGRTFIQFVLRVDTDPTCGLDVKQQAMDVFDRLMEQYGDLAESILAEWDRR